MMALSSSPSDSTSHSSDYVMQKYLLLHNQHEELRQHLYDLCPTYSSSSTSGAGTAVTSPSASPTRSSSSSRPSPPAIHSSRFSPPLAPSAPASRRHRRSSLPSALRSGHRCTQLAPVLDEELMEEMAAGEQQLGEVNEGIKRALTELLNCETVRNDRVMRMWVQTRLMETEKELRVGRRRRSNGDS